MSTIASLSVNLMANSASFVTSMKVAESAVSSFAGGVEAGAAKMGVALTKALGPIGIAVDGLFAIKEAVEKFGASEEHAAKLNAVLEATGQAAGMSAEDVEGLGSELGKLTAFSKGQNVEAMTKLLTFQNVKGDNFQRAIGLAQDLATVMDKDLSSAAVQVGKALNNPITGMKSLHRIGVSFTAQQEQQIKAMVGVGNSAGAQAIILDALSKKYGGAALAVGDTFVGRLKIAKNALGAVSGAFGAVFAGLEDIVNTAIAPVAFAIADGLKALFKPIRIVLANVRDFVAENIQGWITVASPYVSAFVDVVSSAFSGLVDFVLPLVVQWAGAVGETFMMIVEVAESVWSILSTGFMELADTVATGMRVMGVNFEAFSTTWNDVRNAVSAGLLAVEFAFTHWKDIGSLALLAVELEVVTFANTVQYWLTKVIPQYLTWFADNWQNIFINLGVFTKTVFDNLGDNIVNVLTHIPDLIKGESFDDLWKPLTAGFKSTLADLPKILAREQGPLESALQAQVAALRAGIGQDFEEFAIKKLDKVAAQTASLHKLLTPKLAIPKPPKPPDEVASLAMPTGGGSTQLAAFEFGSKEAYSAVNKNENGVISEVKKLNEHHKETNRLLKEDAQSRPKVTVVGIGKK